MTLVIASNLVGSGIAAAVTGGAVWALVLVGIWTILTAVETVEWAVSR